VGDTPPITDRHNRFQTHAPTVLGAALSDARAERLWAPYLPRLGSLGPDVDVPYLMRRTARLGQADRLERLAGGLTDPILRQTGLGLAQLAAGRRDRAEFSLRRALELDPESIEPRAALLTFYQRELLAGHQVSFVRRFTEDPERAVIEGWRARADDDWEAVRALEPRLKGVGARHPVYADAIRLRAGWRVEVGDTAEARYAATLLEPILSPFPQVTDLLLRAQAAAAGAELELALASLAEALPRLPRGGEAAERWHQILRRLPRDDATEEWHRELEARFRRAPDGDPALWGP
jgi:tetratricopeptide (TPR) repeat protein